MKVLCNNIDCIWNESQSCEKDSIHISSVSFCDSLRINIKSINIENLKKFSPERFKTFIKNNELLIKALPDKNQREIKELWDSDYFDGINILPYPWEEK